MNWLNQAFSFYDHLIGSFTPSAQFFVSALLLFLLIMSVISIFKSGHWIFIIVFIILFPSGWPALKTIVSIIWSVIKFLIVRIQLNL